MPSRAIYRGSRRKLVLAFDIGTTYSGVSYSILDPGQIPEIKGVTRFPAQEKTGGTSKIPTIIYYDRSGTVRAVGAEAAREGVCEEAADNQWVKAEWFKLHLRSNVSEEQLLFGNLPPLPLNKTVVEVFADFYRYLLECSAHYIQDTHATGPTLWSSVKNDVEFVLSHPNGWEGKEQDQLRKAAVLAGLVPDDSQKSHDRISFVTEGEASLHFVVQEGVLSSILEKGEGVLIVDAGGGTIDISSYRQNPKEVGTTFDEIAAPQCLFFGSLLVNLNAKVFLQKFLENSEFLEDVDHIVRCFEKTAKPAFKNEHEPQYIKFGSTRDNDPDHNIRIGQLKLPGSEIAEFFKPSATAIKQSVLNQRSTARNKITHVVLVGGLSANDWLFQDLLAFLRRTDPTLNLIRPEERVNKAVSDGALSFYLDHFVRTRISKATYGSICSVQYDPNDKEHQKRLLAKFVDISGETRVRGMFSVILPKNTQVSETKEFRQNFYQVSSNKSDFALFSSPVWRYRGSLKDPKWKDADTANYTELCTIMTNLSHLSLKPLKGYQGRTYYRVDYHVVLLFGLTELKAQIAWKEDGVEKRSPAKIVYDH
ncbi:hypothetical protein BDZ97DRAFT_1402193 [Flammula alnicola]|nr:hypothetical protein BDZ97DRAFT_1402193 [Flammula alnicola]